MSATGSNAASFSVVIPAHDAAATLSDTLDSLLAQTFGGWEAIVVDDGSHDATGEIAAAYAGRDARIRTVRQQQAGEGGARNAAVALARNDWLLFLDADDWVEPQTLARFAEAIVADPGLDAIHCGWIHVDPEGRAFGEHRCELTGDLFDALACSAQFPVHACVVRRALVERAGGFEPSLRSCADWDMWQRIARTGARFGSVPQALSWYRLRPANTWTGGKQFLHDGLRLVAQGHQSDDRVRDPSPVHAAGREKEGLAAARFAFVCAPAAMEIARGGDARGFLDVLPGETAPDLDPARVAHVLFHSAPRSLCRGVSHWADLWPQAAPRLQSFVAALEERAGASGLTRRTMREIERLALEQAMPARPQTVGGTHAVHLEITQPISDVSTDRTVERLQCSLTVEGEPLGVVYLPVCDGGVPSGVIADAIASEHAWRIVGRFFQRSVYGQLEAYQDDQGTVVRRNSTVLSTGLKSEARPIEQWAHERVGWTVFLQELWGQSDWPRERFFAKAGTSQSALHLRGRETIACEVSAELPEITDVEESVDVVVSAGGAALGVVKVYASEGKIGPDRLRAAMTSAGGMELCRVAVREAILGRPFEAQPTGLRERLAVAAAAKAGATGPVTVCSRRSLSRWGCSLPADVMHGWPRSALTGSLRAGTVLASRARPIGTSASRRAALPSGAAREIVESAAAAKELVLAERAPAPPARIEYAPDVIWRPAESAWRRLIGRASSSAPAAGPQSVECTPEAAGPRSERVAILMYHRIAAQGAPATARYRLAPDAFDAQLRALRDDGYRSIDLAEWREAAWSRSGLEGRAVIITFDDGHAEFATEAWPRLKHHGFTAVMFVVAERIGEVASWDAVRGEEPPLMGWDDIRRLAAEGAIFGSHSATHPRLTGLDPAAAVREMARSRAILTRGLGAPVDLIAYPHGVHDAVVCHLAGACGYTFGFTCEPGLAGFDDSLLALPRVEVRGDMSLAEFRSSLVAGEAGHA